VTDLGSSQTLATISSTATGITLDTPAPTVLTASTLDTSNSEVNLLTDEHSKDGGATNDGIGSPSMNNGAARDNASGPFGGDVGMELTTPSQSSGGTLLFSGDTSTLSGWLKDVAKYFYAILTKKHWQALVSKWVMFEQYCRIEGVSCDSSGISNRKLNFYRNSQQRKDRKKLGGGCNVVGGWT
jgi:hypothetical protein